MVSISNLYDSSEWFKEIEEVSDTVPEVKELAGKSVLITGAAGLICSAVIDLFIYYNETHDTPISIIAAGRSQDKMTDRFGEFYNRDYFSFVRYDASKNDNKIDVRADYIIHGAGNASPKTIVAEPVETMLSNFIGLYFLFNYAREISAKRLLYISSSEIYGIKDENRPYTETDYGYIDPLNPRNSYSAGKRAAETLCASFSAEYGVESVIVRPGHIYGPTASQYDTRVSSAWAYTVAKGEDIVMKSDGTQMRSYCYCLDCATAILKVLLRGRNIHAYNISNPNSIISIRKMAEILAKSAGVELKMEHPSEEEKKGFNPMGNSSLDSAELQALGWKGLFEAKRGIACTVEILKELKKVNCNTGNMGNSLLG